MQGFESPTPAIYGEAEAGRSSKVRQILENIRQTISTVNFDMAELLLEATEKNYFHAWGYESRAAFVEQNLDLKDRAVQYLTRVISVSRALNISRSVYEPIGISKAREIFSLEPDAFFDNPETQEKEKIEGHIHRLLQIAPSVGLDAIKAEVRRLKGIVGENDLTWTNFQTTRLTKDNVVLPGLDAFRKYLGSRNIEEKEGSKEYSDGFVLEMICAEILSGAQVQEPGEDIIDEITFSDSDEEAA